MHLIVFELFDMRSKKKTTIGGKKNSSWRLCKGLRGYVTL